ncbi:MAG: cation:proton antiporter [Candidatus Omnitrophica bacterium]|nr:cation:proton antiporter [Candidatus Omnitrophota bacterium]
MADPSFFTDFLIVLIAASLVAIAFERIRLPAILGFLLAGVAVGPGGFGILSDVDRIHQLAELGVVLLMLTIGLEFSFDRLKGLRRVAILGGSLQILLSLGISVLFSIFRGWTLYEGIFLGSVIALSSTAIVFKYLLDRGEVDTQYGRIAISILLFQDLAVVPLLIFISSMGQSAGSVLATFGLALLKTVAFIAGVFLFGRYVFPHLLRQIAMTRNREIFFLTAVVICLGIAWIGGELGLSLAIGAFLAGLMFANSDYGHQLIGEIAPFRHVFVSIFFVSIGLLFEVQFTFDNFFLILTVVGLILLINSVIMTVLLVAFQYPLHIALAAGLILSQIGEFSFLLLEAGRTHGGIDFYIYHVLLSVAFLTMLFTPALFALVPILLRFAENMPMLGVPKKWREGEERASLVSNHVILCGYGPSGRDLAVTFKQENISFVMIDMNPKNIQDARKKGFIGIYGDVGNAEVLNKAGIRRARAVVVSFGDPIGMAQVIRVVQRLNPDVVLVVRSRAERDAPALYELGADMVVMEEWEASYELNRIILEEFKIPEDRVKKNLERIRERKELIIEEAILKKAPPVEDPES